MSYSNLLVTLSNIFGVYPIIESIRRNNKEALVISLISVVGSILQHLSDTKHEQPGLFFIKYSKCMLNLDRITAILSTIYLLRCLYKKPVLLTPRLSILATAGLILNVLSENLRGGLVFFVSAHSLWHYLAFKIMGDIIRDF